MPSPQQSQPEPPPSEHFGGAVGVGIVLVLLPGLALYFGFKELNEFAGTGLPIVALFGIVVLVGSLALTSTLFRRLGLARPSQPLGLPPGSVRATIALALIVLFAIIAASVLRPSGEPYKISGLTGAQKEEMLRDSKRSVLGVVPEPCATEQKPDVLGTVSDCSATDQRFAVTVRPGLSGVALDLAKELLALIGQLMTMAVSFYFAARTAAKPTEAKPSATPDTPADPNKKVDLDPKADAIADPDLGTAGHEDHVDGCNVVIENPTLDHELPPSRGGVAKP